jgi:DUF2993 family protein
LLEALAAKVKPKLRDLRGVRGLRGVRDPLSIVLILCTAVALLGAGLIGAELYARKRAARVVAAAAECTLKDPVKVSIGIGPMPFLMQYITNNYTGISIHTAGNQIRNAKGMRADITVNDVNLKAKNNSKGTIGAVDADVTWTSGGIRATLEEGISLLKQGMLQNIITNSGAGTIQLSAALGLASVTLKPKVSDGALSLDVVELTAMGTRVPSEAGQAAMKAVNSKLMKNVPLGMRAETVRVTNDGVAAHFTKHNAQISASDPCFAHI